MPEPRRQMRPLSSYPTVRNDPGDWRTKALCRNYPAHWWDDSLDGARETAVNRAQRHAHAIEVCRQCPVAAQCEAEYDRERDEGVRFGRVLPPLDRSGRSGPKGGRVLEPIRHGTEAGYRAHIRRGEHLPPFDPCGCLSAARRRHGIRAANRVTCDLCGRDMAHGHLRRHMRDSHGGEEAS